MNAPRAPMLTVDRLGFAYPSQPPLFSGWSVSLAAGLTWLHGDTGSGKSTLLRRIAGVLPGAGRLSLRGVDLDTDRDGYRQRVFFCDPSDAAFDNVDAHRCTEIWNAGDAAFDAAAWRALVEGFTLTPHLDKPLFMLSTGTRRKVGLAAALASGRALVLLDEPTGGLDAPSLRCLRSALGRAALRADQLLIVASFEAPPDGIPLAASVTLPLRPTAA